MSDTENGSASDPLRGHESLHEALGLGEGQAQCLDLCPICRAADVLRASATPEMREQWQSVQREALVTLKERLDEEPAGEPESRIEEIPID
jgi:hypothetical protein